MTKTKRNIAQEILDGIRQIKRAERGRVTNVPSMSSVREKTALTLRRETSGRVRGVRRPKTVT